MSNNAQSLGIRTGFNLASVRFNSSNSNQKSEHPSHQRVGLIAGIYGESAISKYSAIQADLLYTTRGYNNSNKLNFNPHCAKATKSAL